MSDITSVQVYTMEATDRNFYSENETDPLEIATPCTLECVKQEITQDVNDNLSVEENKCTLDKIEDFEIESKVDIDKFLSTIPDNSDDFSNETSKFPSHSAGDEASKDSENYIMLPSDDLTLPTTRKSKRPRKRKDFSDYEQSQLFYDKPSCPASPEVPVKRKVLSLNEKVKLLQEVQEHIGSQVSLAEKYNLPQTTLTTIIKNRDKIMVQALKYSSQVRTRMKGKDAKFEIIEVILKRWFLQNDLDDLTACGILLREKALEIAAALGMSPSEFRASSGWLGRFKERHGLLLKDIKKRNVIYLKHDHLISWANYLSTITKNYEPDCVYNICETALWYNLYPSEVISRKREIDAEKKFAHQQLTIVFTINGNGEKLEPLVIGPGNNFPSSMSLPTKYLNSDKPFLNSETFSHYLHCLDAKMYEANKNIIVFLDQSPAHSGLLNLKNITLAFWPKKAETDLPLQSGVIKSFKSHYRTQLAKKYFAFRKEKIAQPKIPLFDALRYVMNAWKNVPFSVIKKSFNISGFFTPSPLRSDINEVINSSHDFHVMWRSFKFEIPFKDYLSIDDNLSTSIHQTLEEIIEEQKIKFSSIPVETEPSSFTPPFANAVDAFDILKNYLCSLNSNPTLYAKLTELEEDLINACIAKKRKNVHLPHFISYGECKKL